MFAGRLHSIIIGWHAKSGGIVLTCSMKIYWQEGSKKASSGVEKPIRLSTGREWDRETGLYYNRARYYDPMEGRFLSKDKIGFKGGINLYSYVQENPINNIDPFGLWKYGPPWSGNKWCGPNWTGGKEEPYTPGHSYAPPANELDKCCEAHDKCYYQCRKDYPCDYIKRDLCMTNKCDRDLAHCAASAGHKFSSPLWWWMNFNSTPDPGPDASSCGGK